MHPLVRLPYALSGQLARLAASLAPVSEQKLAASLRGRRGIRTRFAAWGARHRDPSRPLLWVHAPSVGEGLQARPVIERLRARHPALQLAYTFYSPSAESFADTMGADFSDYLPFDTAGDAGAALDALRPSVLLFSKVDIWPTLAERAAQRGVRLGLISATLSGESGRRSRLASLLLSDAYRSLDAVGAIDARDAERLTTLGVRRDRVIVTGDTRYDQVWARAQSVDRSGPLLAPIAGARPTLVAGSTWPADEAVLLEAWRAVRERVPGARLILAPHEPVALHLAPIEGWARREGLSLARLGADGAGDADVLLIDRVGVLGELYALANLAFVGGGFHAAGLHSVLEPAAFGVPVLFGQENAGRTMSRDAVLLLERGGGFAARSARELGERMTQLFTDAGLRSTAGAAARALVQSGLGAADRSAALVERLLAEAAPERPAATS